MSCVKLVNVVDKECCDVGKKYCDVGKKFGEFVIKSEGEQKRKKQIFPLLFLFVCRRLFHVINGEEK